MHGLRWAAAPRGEGINDAGSASECIVLNGRMLIE